ncbi:Eukaryotic translation initiation factor 2-alpha kinase 4 [Orchesella cincta]|uniref:non-specific serine/threonine protein kinase n=1 Tax=Orchesella cincta TaxID=48709 RepID=A0A1D2MV84_ORCCI|nr:Eukaryotic translation initiation factor 2-alpha kinase 4 [Orchesella cincta]
MFYHPLPTSMERVRVITGLRLPAVSFPRDFDELLMPQVSHITRWLLSHDPSRRPTSLELLQSDYLPPPPRRSRTAIPVVGMKCFHFFHKLKLTVQKVFERHGGLELGTPILMPKTQLYDEDNESCVNLMCHSGNIVALPHDLRIPFARYIGRYGITHLKRYAIEKVFRERKVYGLHPRELVECAFDIVDCTPGSLIADAEILSIALESHSRTTLVQKQDLHIAFGAHEAARWSTAASWRGCKVESASSRSQIQTYLCSRGLPEHFISMLFALMEVEGSLPKVSNLLKSITKRKGESASLIKAGLHELEILMNHVDNLGFKCGVAIVPTMVFGSHIYSGLLFQVVCNLRKRKNKMTVDVIAAGGRYDGLIESFRGALALESELTAATASKEHYSQSQCAVGISISFDKLVAGYDGEDCSEWQRRGTVDAVICSVGHHPLAKEKLELMKELWTHGIKCTVLECSQTLEAAEEQCKEMGAQFMLILKENEFYSNLRVRIWERVMFQERKMSRQEAVELISRRVNGCVTNEAYSSSTNVGTNRSESLSTKVSSSTGTESNVSSVVASNSTMALLNISFVVQEREKLANWKKRYENQARSSRENKNNNTFSAKLMHAYYMSFQTDMRKNVTDCSNSSVVNTLAACLVSSDKDEFHKGKILFVAFARHTRLRKYLQNICDEIYELWFEKSASVIILYGLIDNSYRVLF